VTYSITLKERSGDSRGTLATVLIGFLLFFFVYSVEFSFLPVHTSRIISVFGGLMLLLISIRASHRVVVDQQVLLVTALLSGFVVWVGIRTAMTGAEDLSLLIAGALIIIQVLPGAAAIAYVLRRLDFDFDKVIQLLYAIIAIQALLIVVSFFSWDFKQWTLAHIPPSSNVDPLHPFRVRGLTHGTGAKLSAFQGAGLIMAAYLLMKCQSYSELARLLALSVLIVASIVLTGRTGVLAIPLAVALLGTRLLITGKINRKSAVAVLALPAALVIGFLLFQQYYLFLGGWDSTTAGSDAMQSLIRWFSEDFVALMSDDRLSESTVGVLLQYHWFLPKSDTSLIFGDPNTWSLARIHSDVGVVRMLFGAGLVGTTLLYIGVLAMFISMLGWCRSIEQQALIALLAVWMALVELKEPYFLDLRYLSFICVLFFFLCFGSKVRPS
jgi:hypothetical protein